MRHNQHCVVVAGYVHQPSRNLCRHAPALMQRKGEIANLDRALVIQRPLEPAKAHRYAVLTRNIGAVWRNMGDFGQAGHFAGKFAGHRRIGQFRLIGTRREL